MRAHLHGVAGDTGPHVVFLHGFGADRLSWLAVAPMLGDVARVWAVDLPGHGQADDDVGDGRASTLAGAVAGALVALDGPIRLVGHSLGGLIALHMAAGDPGRFAPLALLAPAGVGGRPDPAFLRAFPVVQSANETQALLVQMVARPRHIAPVMVDHVLTSLAQPMRRTGLLRVAEALIAHDLLPTTRLDGAAVIWGADDRIAPPPAGLATPTLPGVGHLPQIEAAGAVHRTLRAELGRIAALAA